MEEDRLGVSVHWLKYGFLEEEVCASSSGLSRDSSIYDIEDLSSETHGLIRQKGANLLCPLDHLPGTSYVHALPNHEDLVGPADFMLSYSWSYSIGDIVDTLWDYCRRERNDPKRTHVWICCLCNNQHRVADHTKKISFEDFRRIFYNRVTGIGHVLALMTPWQAPVYLTRIWCIFELFTAAAKKGHEMEVTIVAPPREQTAMAQAIGEQGNKGIDILYQTLANTRVEKASASFEEDKRNVFQLIQEGPGFRTLNLKVNDLLRQWVQGVIQYNLHLFELRHAIREETSGEDYYSKFLANVGDLFVKNGDFTEALKSYAKALLLVLGLEDRVRCDTDYLYLPPSIWNSKEPKVAPFYNQIGYVYLRMGDYNRALEIYQQAFAAIRGLKRATGEEQPLFYQTVKAETGFHMGCIYEQIETEELTLAREYYQESLSIRETVLGADHIDTASSYEKLSSLLFSSLLKDECDYDLALFYARKSFAVRQAKLGENHPQTAASCALIGSLRFSKGNSQDALQWHQRALAIRESVLGIDHLDTASCHNHIGAILEQKGDWNGALESYRKCAKVQQAMLGKDHPDFLQTQRSITQLENNQEKRDLSGRLTSLHNKAVRYREERDHARSERDEFKQEVDRLRRLLTLHDIEPDVPTPDD